MKRCMIVAAAIATLAAGAARAEISGGIVRVGILNDANGVFGDTNGQGSIEAARLAVEDFAGGGRGIRVEIVAGDHQNKPDVGSVLVRRWIDLDGVDAVADVPNSSVGLAVNSLARGTAMTFLATSTASADLTGKDCSPNTIQWITDTWVTGNTTAAAMMKRGGDSWYFLTVDYALGKGIEAEATRYVEGHGGKVLGASRHPLGTADFSSFLLQAQSSRAKVIGIANAGADTVNVVKQAAEFGLTGSGQSLILFLAFINDIDGMGLANAKGLMTLEAFYWDLNDETRAFAKRFAARMGGKMPSTNQAGVYSQVLAYLKAVAATDSDDARQVVPQMKRTRYRDPLFGDMSVREDGRAIHPTNLFQVKSPAESRYPWDYYTLVEAIPAEQAYRPMAEGGCPLVKP